MTKRQSKALATAERNVIVADRAVKQATDETTYWKARRAADRARKSLFAAEVAAR